jgi:hypothetical protein
LIACSLAVGLLLLGNLARATETEELATPDAAAANCCGCCWHPCICYEHRGCPICCSSCSDAPAIKTSIKVTDPCTCCTVDVPLCLPGCCTGAPCCVKDRCPILFNRLALRYEYCCGVAVVIKVKKCGDIVVTYVHA